MYRALYNFVANTRNTLSFDVDDRFTVINKKTGDWWMVQDGLGRVGYVPSNYLTPDDVRGYNLLHVAVLLNTSVALPLPFGAPAPSFDRAGPPSCPICSHLHHVEPGLFRGWPFGMKWSPIGSLVTSKSTLPEIPSAT